MTQAEALTPDAPAVPKTFDEALRGLVNRERLAAAKYQDQQWVAHRDGADPTLLEFERVFVKRMAKLGVPMYAHCVWRSGEAQDDLYRRGFSKAQAGQSPHNHGMAVDLVHSVLGWSLAEKQWELIGHVGKELAAQNGWKLVWGGDWKFYDPAHWEIADWRAKRL